jgi:hypothetical protein
LSACCGGHVFTDEVERKVAEGLLKESDSLRKAAMKLDDIAGRIL